MEWFFHTRLWQRMQGNDGGETGVDNRTVEQGFEGIGAWILGRNMFGPVRGPWPDDSWKGWWGDEPPYHTPVFVLTHHARAPLKMAGGTEFRFVTDGIHAALQQAQDAAGADDPNVWKVPGGTFGLWAAAISGFLATAISVALVFVPPAGTGNVVNYEVNLMGQAAIVLGIGGALYWFSGRNSPS